LKQNLNPIRYLWQDRRRRCGLPLSFTRYRLSEDRLFVERGFLNLREEELLLYRVVDLELRRSLWQRLFGTGTVCVHSSDRTSPHLDLISVSRPREVKELIYRQVELARQGRNIRPMELLDGEQELWDEPHDR
jgi:uncharacterized membrane protein YdbT with pleckstrin-like domain